MILPRPTSMYSPVVLVKRSRESLLLALDSGTWYERERRITESVKALNELEQVLRKAAS
jgi:hypothetical protein